VGRLCWSSGRIDWGWMSGSIMSSCLLFRRGRSKRQADYLAETSIYQKEAGLHFQAIYALRMVNSFPASCPLCSAAHGEGRSPSLSGILVLSQAAQTLQNAWLVLADWKYSVTTDAAS
jgi:hypothetical protein